MSNKKTAFIFAGIGSQWETMGSGLSEEPVFRQTIEACDRIFSAYSGWSITEALKQSKDRSRLHDLSIAPPCICALEIALMELLKSWKIEPDAVIGHSIGEAAAAYTAGILTLQDVFGIIWHHSVILRKIEWSGATAHVSLRPDQIQALQGPSVDHVWIAAYNSPNSTVISGDKKSIGDMVETLTQRHIFCKIFDISIPYHTPLVEPYREYLCGHLRDLRAEQARIPIYSTLHGRQGKASDYGALYWSEHMCRSVQFASGIESMLRDGYTRFVEISPHAILLGCVKEVFDHEGNTQCTLIPTLMRREDEKKALFTAVARLFRSGYALQWERFQPEKKAQILKLANLLDREEASVQSAFFSVAEMDKNALRRHLIELVRFAIVNVSGGRLTPTDDDELNLFDSGMDSMTAFQLSKLLSSTLKIMLPVALVFEHSTISALAEHLINVIEKLPVVNGRSSDPAPALPQDRFELVDFIETQNNPLFGQLAEFHLNVTHQQHRLLDIEGRKFIDFASCNYLGFDYHPDIMAAIPVMVEQWGVHPSWTRLVASPAPYRELEERLAEFIKAPAVLVFPCIAMLNFGALPILAGPNGVLLCDSAAHHTVQEACQLASAKGVTCAHFRYNDPDDLERQLRNYSSKSPKIVAVDGIYSMTANYVDLPAYGRIIKRYDDAFLFVDDAHGFGVIGENPTDIHPYGHKGNGIVNYFGMDYVEDRVIYVTGMSKAFSSFAAFIVCLNREMERKLRLSSTYVFSGPIPVASLASSLAGLKVNETEGDRIRARLYKLSHRLASGARSLGFDVDNYGSCPIVYVVIGKPEATVGALNIAWKRGLLVSPGIFPAVPINHGGLRFSVTAINTEAEIDTALSILEEIKEKLM